VLPLKRRQRRRQPCHVALWKNEDPRHQRDKIHQQLKKKNIYRNEDLFTELSKTACTIAASNGGWLRFK
jgi:hypothetical protein